MKRSSNKLLEGQREILLLTCEGSVVHVQDELELLSVTLDTKA